VSVYIVCIYIAEGLLVPLDTASHARHVATEWRRQMHQYQRQRQS
jgi:hypothetical protein